MFNQFITHPDGGICFGFIPALTLHGEIIPESEIRLIHGKHSGPNRGWGAAHIWAEHSKEMKKLNLHKYEDVNAYVARIICRGTQIFFEGGNIRKIRVMAVKSAAGTAVLEYRTPRGLNAFWSVVTAHSGKKPHGTLIGAVRLVRLQ